MISSRETDLLCLMFLSFFLSRGGSFSALMTRDEAVGTTETAAWRFWIVSLTVTRSPFCKCESQLSPGKFERHRRAADVTTHPVARSFGNVLANLLRRKTERANLRRERGGRAHLTSGRAEVANSMLVSGGRRGVLRLTNMTLISLGSNLGARK